MVKMAKQKFWITCLALGVLSIYLFVSAPPPLAEKTAVDAAIPAERMFEILKAENDVVRAMWTKEVVGAGKQIGLKFDERWREADVEAGPLPALFLRETAKSLEKNPSSLSLFLGSDYPINSANRFEGLQLEKFQAVKQTLKPQFFFMPDIQMWVAMFSDVAVVEGCIQCHNKHEQSPKHDWKLHDVMGATTWMYPSGSVSMDELLRTLTALRQGFKDAYEAYLEKVRKFANPPAIGEHWPTEGYFLPASEVFMGEIAKRTAPQTLAALSVLADKSQSGSATNKEGGSFAVAR
jgi:adenylate cyclase